MACTHIRNCELFVQFALNPALGIWQSAYCNDDYSVCARYQTSLEGKVVPLSLLPNGKKITVKGVVTKHDLTDPQNCMVYLGEGIACNFGHLKAMAESYKVGDEVYVDGFLERLEEGDILLVPAMGRDPEAPFHPVE